MTPQSKKPGIIVMSTDSDDGFKWMSDGWNRRELADTPMARELMRTAIRTIEAAADVRDAIERLKEAGFAVRRQRG